jgi:hypothetical protein
VFCSVFPSSAEKIQQFGLDSRHSFALALVLSAFAQRLEGFVE